jgi:hypothetical protein
MGLAVRRPEAHTRLLRLSLAAFVLVAGVAGGADPARIEPVGRYVMIVTGVAGSPEHAERHTRWRDQFIATATGRLSVPLENLYVLGEHPPEAPGAQLLPSTADGVRSALGSVARRMRRGDLLLVMLLGHGTFDGVDAKFNLMGPDLEAAQWQALLATLPGTVVFVNTASASFPFLSRLAGARRVVITATSSAAQRFDTVFAEFFVEAFDTDDADLDKNGRVSIGEAFSYASRQTTRWYEQRGQLPTERALLDGTGDGTGQEAGDLGPDVAMASRLFLDPSPDEALSSDPALSQLIGRRDALEAELDELKRKRDLMPPGDYARELERVLIEIARLSRQIRSRS